MPESADRAHRTDAPQFAQPYWWIAFAVAMLYVPAVGYMIQSDMPGARIHPAVNAMLNATGTVFLVSGWLAIRRGNQALHMRCMITAFALAIAFLGSYLARYSLTGSHRYPGDGADKVAYLVVLASHSALAAIAMPMAAVVVYLAWRRRFAAHRRLARWTWPIWLYVSVTGVVVYLMLYPLADALHGP